MKSYPSYKESGVEWIGEIPNGWGLKKLQYLGNTNVDSIQIDEFKDSDVLHYSIPNVQEYGMGMVEEGGSIDSSKIRLFGGEVIISKLNPRKNCVTIVKESEYLIVGSGEFLVVKPHSINSKYLYYNFKNQSFTDFLDSSVESVTRSHQRVKPEMVFKSRFPLPPLSEQHQIVSFLDKRTSQIDELIEKKRKKIELLKEYRTSLINHTVTKGLNPNVEMKDSGVEWIGEIPKGWEVKKLKYFGEVTLGKMLTNDDKGGYHLKSYLRSSNIQSEKVDVSDVKEMWFSESELKKYRLKTGDLLFNEGGDVGRSCLWNGELEECYIQNSVNRVRLVGDEKYFLFHSLLHHQFGYFNSVVDRVSIPHLTKEKLEIIPFIIPPLSEQHQIVEYLNEQTSKIDEELRLEERKIELLKEYRTSLISDVVTGKICVLEEV